MHCGPHIEIPIESTAIENDLVGEVKGGAITQRQLFSFAGIIGVMMVVFQGTRVVLLLCQLFFQSIVITEPWSQKNGAPLFSQLATIAAHNLGW